MSALLLVSSAGCRSFWTSDEVVLGGDRQQYFPPNTPVPAMTAEENTDGVIVLPKPVWKAMMSL